MEVKKYKRLRTKRKFNIWKQKALKETKKLCEFFSAVIVLGGITVMIFSTKTNVQAEGIQTTTVVVSNTVAGFVPDQPPSLLENPSNDLVVIPTILPSNLEEKKKYITSFLESRGEDVARWMKIINGESQFNPDSVAETYWSLCDRAVSVKLWGYQQGAKNFIELRDYPNGIWQATCEEFGAITLRTGHSAGLVHIIETTWENSKCEGDRMNWIDNLNCAFKIRDIQGWKAWSTN